MPRDRVHKPISQKGASRTNGRQAREPDGEQILLTCKVAPGVQRSYNAFLAALPGLLRDGKRLGQWAAFHGREFVAFDKSETKLYQLCFGLGYRRTSFYVGWISPQGTDACEEVDPSLFEFDDPVPRTTA